MTQDTGPQECHVFKILPLNNFKTIKGGTFLVIEGFHCREEL